MGKEKIREAKETKIGNVTFRRGNNGKWQCHVCEEYSLNEPDSWGYCPVCGAPNNIFFCQGNSMDTYVTIDEAREQWKNNKKVNWDW